MTNDAEIKNGEYTLSLYNRERLSLTGVTEVASFDERVIILKTLGGSMQICGSDLKMERLDLDKNEVELCGRIDSMDYSDDEVKQGGFLSRVFR